MAEAVTAGQSSARYHPRVNLLMVHHPDREDPRLGQAAQAVAEPVVPEAEAGQVVVLAAVAASKGAQMAPLYLALRYFGTFPFNFLIAALTGALTSRPDQ